MSISGVADKISNLHKRPFYLSVPYRILEKLTGVVSVRLGTRKLKVPVDRSAYGLLVHTLDWKTELIQKFLAFNEGDLLDIGSNIGQTLIDFLANPSERRYIGFEPNAYCVDLLRRIIEINRLDNCQVVPIALANRNELGMFYTDAEDKADSGASLVAGSGTKKNLARPETISFVPCYRFDDIVDRVGVSQIGLIKIDVEGAELELLKGMEKTLLERRPSIICEVLYAANGEVDEHEKGLRDLESFIKTSGYKIFHIEKEEGSLAFKRLRQIDRFPTGRLTRTNFHECDFAFLPKEIDSQRLVEAGLPV